MGNLMLPAPLLAQVAPSDTFYTQAPEWGWMIVLYFFLGGISGGAAFLAAMLHLFGGPGARPMARIGYAIALVALVPCPILLIVDLNQPARFWHMLIASETGAPLLKWWSPISLGVWILTLFGIVLFLTAIGAFAADGRLPRGLAVLGEGPVATVLAALTGLGGLALAGYTGALLTATNRPLWADTTLLGLLFLLSGVSAGAAAMLLVGWVGRANPGAMRWLGQMDAWTTIIELVVLVVLVIGLGAVAMRVLGNGWGVALLVGTVLVGLLAPLAIHWRPRLFGAASVPVAAVLVLVGSFVLRTVIVLASEAV